MLAHTKFGKNSITKEFNVDDKDILITNKEGKDNIELNAVCTKR